MIDQPGGGPAGDRTAAAPDYQRAAERDRSDGSDGGAQQRESQGAVAEVQKRKNPSSCRFAEGEGDTR